MSDSEEWRRVVGHPNYMVSSEGRVKSIDRACMTPGGWLLPRRGVELKPWLIKSTGYLQVGLDNIKRESVHRLVALAFCPGYADGLVVNHINGIKTDNRAANLEWVTHSYNMRHPLLVLGKRNKNLGRRGVEAPKITAVVATNIQSGEELFFACASDAVRQHGFDSGCITRCCQGKSASHKGWLFRFHSGTGYPHKPKQLEMT